MPIEKEVIKYVEEIVHIPVPIYVPVADVIEVAVITMISIQNIHFHKKTIGFCLFFAFQFDARCPKKSRLRDGPLNKLKLCIIMATSQYFFIRKTNQNTSNLYCFDAFVLYF